MVKIKSPPTIVTLKETDTCRSMPPSNGFGRSNNSNENHLKLERGETREWRVSHSLPSRTEAIKTRVKTSFFIPSSVSSPYIFSPLCFIFSNPLPTRDEHGQKCPCSKRLHMYCRSSNMVREASTRISLDQHRQECKSLHISYCRSSLMVLRETSPRIVFDRLLDSDSSLIDPYAPGRFFDHALILAFLSIFLEILGFCFCKTAAGWRDQQSAIWRADERGRS